MDTTFSIIIPVYNVAPYLRECLDSIAVAAENVADIDCVSVEVICIDDGSSDGSERIVDEYAAKHGSGRFLVKAYHQKNAGPSVARNIGIKMACGEWVSFVDSDDSVTPDYFRRFIALERKADINFFAITRYDQFGVSRTVSYDSNGIVYGERGIVSVIKRLYLNSGGTNLFGFTVNKFVRREIIVRGNIHFVDGLHVSEDEVFTLAASSRIKSIQSIPHSLYRYRWLAKGLTAQFRLDALKLIAAFEAIGCADGIEGVREIGRWRALREAYSAFRRSLGLATARQFLSFYRRLGAVYDGCGSKAFRMLVNMPMLVAAPMLFLLALARRLPASIPIVREES